ncbi:hypothetical protein HELRODRAFT_164445 [Helobdella robusta]|uniref:Cep192-like domain-containing protein n=1 Tax=Helobdella robusta TaxID=6412 RepID=T1EVF1_HELRO|nr:hypothetical protein HELRODRAFT_164445 [Helobdella robusta]ESN94581.1 hypothetical protein HELRODRAFT_164445 [Helobdella robusta]
MRKFSKVCCIGMSTESMILVKNVNVVSIQLEISMLSLSVDAVARDVDIVKPFIFKKKLTMAPQSEDVLKVIFSPVLAGLHECQLCFRIVQPSNLIAKSYLSSFATVIAESELPNIVVRAFN